MSTSVISICETERGAQLTLSHDGEHVLTTSSLESLITELQLAVPQTLTFDGTDMTFNLPTTDADLELALRLEPALSSMALRLIAMCAGVGRPEKLPFPERRQYTRPDTTAPNEQIQPQKPTL